MMDYAFHVYSNADLGGSGTTSDLSLGTQVDPGATRKVLMVADDDTVLDDEADFFGQTRDSSQQVLAQDFEGLSAGQVVLSSSQYPIANATTGEAGTLYLLRLYSGTDPDNRGDLDGQHYYAADIELNPGDSFALGPSYFIGQVPYADLHGFAINCFAGGTRIETDRGPVPVEALCPGDLVRTLDHGFQPLRWIGSRTVAAKRAFAPVVICRGAMGNARDLIVSQCHRMLISGWRSEALFGTPEVLVTARALVNGDTTYLRPGGTVTYHHLLFDTHQIVFAEGAPAESYHPARAADDIAAGATHREVLALFPELADPVPGPIARPAITDCEAAIWTARAR